MHLSPKKYELLAELVVILDAHDGAALIIVPPKAGATPAAPQPAGADSAPRTQ